MILKIIRVILTILLTFYLTNCNNSTKNTLKIHPNDPFKNTIVKSQKFNIDSKQDNIIEAKKGTIIICPKGCFLNSKDQIVEENIEIEVAEALSLDDMILSNLTTTSNGKLLETDGMIYFNATANGEQLTINKNNPIHIEIPTKNKKDGMKAYKGIRDENGNMNWVKPQEIDNYLKIVDINTLDFLPQNFQNEVENGMPFRNYKNATEKLTDSLFYSLSVSNGKELSEGLISPTLAEQSYRNNIRWNYSSKKLNNDEFEIIIKAQINKGWVLYADHSPNIGPIPIDIKISTNNESKLVGTINKTKSISFFDPIWGKTVKYYKNGAEFRQRVKLTKDQSNIHISIHYQICNKEGSLAIIETEESDINLSNNKNCGIDPAIIKVIKSPKYQNTLISTKEFESRLKLIYKTCNNEILKIYINNLNKNLFELDSLAAITLGESEYKEAFIKLSKLKQTKVKESDKYAKLLNGYFNKQFKKVKKELKTAKEKLLKELKNKNEKFEKVSSNYEELLWKREKYRMETYGFNWTETGWINIDKGTQEKDWDSYPLSIKLTNGKQFDRAYTYVIYTSIKSLIKLNTINKEEFSINNIEQQDLLMPKEKSAVAFAIGYIEDVPYLAVQEFITGKESQLSLTLIKSSIKSIKEATLPFENYNTENSINEDLEYMFKIYKEEQRQKVLVKESEFILRLWNLVHPCCVVHEFEGSYD